MYHCHVLFYLVGSKKHMFEHVKEMPALEGFTHEFTESENPEREHAARADIILAGISGMDADDTLKMLLSWKRQDAELIIMSEKEQPCSFFEHSDEIADIWTLPASADEIRFHFLRWQQSYKIKKDFWQTSQYLEAAINSTPDLIWYKDKNGIHEKVNDSFCRTVGKAKDDVEGRTHAYIWNVEEDDPACEASERMVMEKRETCISDEIIKTGDKTNVLKTYKSPLYDLDGSVMGTVGVAIDVTRERSYAQEIFKKNQTLETLFTTMDCGVMCHTLDGSRVISINQAALDILGYKSMEDLRKDGFLMVAHSVLDEDKPKLRESIKSIKNVDDSSSVEYRVRHENGDIRYVFGSIKLMEEGGELYYQRFLLDRTAQRREEEEEYEKDKRRQMELVHALSADYNVVCFFDLDTQKGKLLRCDKCRKNLLEPIFNGELYLKECMERYIEMGVHEEDKELLRRAVSKEYLEEELSQKSVSYTGYRMTCCEEKRYFQLKAVRAGKWEQNRGVVLGFRNVDEETRSEREKKALLESALSQANSANRAKSTFLSNMSHDIRTPMNAIIGFTSLAITHINNKEQVEEYLKKIMTSGNHLLSLINDVLDMSRIESGKIHLEEDVCSLPDIMHELRNIIQADINAKQLNLNMEAVDIQHEEICCDRLRLNQVLINLLSNAMKYTSAGGAINMTVTEKAGAPQGHANYEFCIKDTGIGMSEEFVSRIFEPFERERNSTISGIQGTGLGMAITKNIVDMMNGSIEVNSSKESGTECIVRLTFRVTAEKREHQAIPELNGFRALVVDDDFNTCDNVSCMLGQIGLRTDWTLSGKEAVLRNRQAIMRDDRYSVYIIDWLLPDMNGVEVARRIRQENGKDVPIIILTAYDWTDIEEEAKAAGVKAFCSKPLFQSELRECLYSIVNADKKTKTDKVKKEKLRTGHILLVEDNELNQEIAVAILNEAGFSVDVAPNGQEAVNMVENAAPGYYQVVLMDIQMPVMNGYEATRKIRSLENKELASIPIAAMTANAFEEDKQAAINSGMDGHISKPIDVKALMEMLDEMLGDKAGNL